MSSWIDEPRLCGGIMTGTSLDGIDVAVARWSRQGEELHYEVVASETYEFTPAVVDLLSGIIHDQEAQLREISWLNAALAHEYARAMRRLCAANAIEIKDLHVVGCHGQTVWHSPQGEAYQDLSFPSTLQLGSGTALAALLGVPVAYDFRSADIALGGQGAPLIPIFDRAVFRSSTVNRVLLNIGGIANISIIDAKAEPSDVKGFDTGPGNVLIDIATRQGFGMRYDEDGRIARSGVVLPRLFNALQEDAFILQAPPKSTGREKYNVEYLRKAMQYTVFDSQPGEDITRTVTEFTAWSIAKNIEKYAPAAEEILVAGGGARNTFLLERLASYCIDKKVITTDSVGIPIDGREALCFSYLAWLRMGGLHGTLPSVTGASRPTVAGAVAIP